MIKNTELYLNILQKYAISWEWHICDIFYDTLL